MKIKILWLLSLQCSTILTNTTVAQPLPIKDQQNPQHRPSANPEAIKNDANDDDKSTQRVLLVFSQMLTNFMFIVKDNKNHAVVGANIIQMLIGMLNIGMEMFRNNPYEQEVTPLTHADQELIKKIKKQLILLAEEIKAHPDREEYL